MVFLLLLAVGLTVAGCSDPGDPTTAATAPEGPLDGGDPTRDGPVEGVDPPPAETRPTVTAPSSTGPPATETTNMPTDDVPPPCRRLTDFDSADANQRWLVVNDDVMGGRSLGGLSFDQDRLVFEGEINTDGGGFSSLRLPLEPGLLIGRNRIEFRARPDDRSYLVTFDDSLPSRNRRVSHRAPIGFVTPGEWQTVSVSFEDLFPAVFGRPIDDLPLRIDLVTRMGLMISDGVDGPFRLEIDWIDICSGDPEPA